MAESFVYPKAEAIIEDLTFTLQAQTEVGPIITSMLSIDPLISSVELITIYGQNYSFKITYLDPDASLSTDSVEPIRKKIVTQLVNQCGASLVGTLE